MGFVSLTLDEIRKKCWSFFKIVNDTSGAREGSEEGVLEMVYDKFRVFDWKGQVSSGLIFKKVFSFLIKMIGFPLTKNEIRMIATQFAVMSDDVGANVPASKIAYQRFLGWCSSSTSSSTAVVHVVPKKQIKQSRQVINFMEKQLSRGIDVLSIFRRYDLTNSSKITISDFCCAIHDLGLSSISLVEAKEIAETFHSLSTNGSFISYQKIIAELLRNIDYHRQKEVINVSPSRRGSSSRSRSREGGGGGENRYEDDHAEVDPLDRLIKVLSHSGEQNNFTVNDLCLKLKEAIEVNKDKRKTGQIHRDDLWSILLHSPFHCGDGLDKRDFLVITRRYSSTEGIDWVNYLSLIRSLQKRYLHDNDRRQEREVGRSRDRSDLSSDLMEELKAAVERLILKGKLPPRVFHDPFVVSCILYGLLL
jgi:Ca2+-binding EF-hand superfamily protein